ncbi:NlpC/P60 family protein [Vibrio tubiashii]|uniref:NlpC/P60 family protein n=1 Tax=Vibrio tubiashii TaxID=29498 RepID=UPI001EFC5F00|nr:NlpC/P60 family protein [Vibrio tubiashii]MCG9582518.1 NlpC/P60 family protein [Vibrio tubiashii]MCG9616109.1 NlpC/P60 family protein [Vibrio tubiashii]MCG9688555.1 NlpC/P60 family protein [Vibrio tubiashii]
MKHRVFSASHFKTALLCLAIAGCSNQPNPEFSAQNSAVLTAQEEITKSSLLDVYQVWKGAPYRLGGSTLSGVDCSAFVQTTYKDALGLQLPRTTLAQVELGKEIEYSDAYVGDLVFFRTAPKVRHVGVYIGNKQFMHASTSKGVIISRLDNPYWASKYWHFRRVAYSPEMN